MVIRRIYKEPTDPAPARVPLGRIAVTIDDLRALLELLRAHPDVEGEVVVKFDGESEFTHAEDMRELSDASLGDLRVKAGELTVSLSRGFSLAIGPAELCNFVHNSWARSLRTRQRLLRNSIPPVIRAAYGFLLLVAVIVIGAGLYQDATATDRDRDGVVESGGLSSLIFGGFIILFVIVFLILGALNEAKRDLVFLIPFTMDEMRKNRQIKSQVPAWSLVVAVVALIASVAFNVITLVKGGPPAQ